MEVGSFEKHSTEGRKIGNPRSTRERRVCYKSMWRTKFGTSARLPMGSALPPIEPPSPAMPGWFFCGSPAPSLGSRPIWRFATANIRNKMQCTQTKIGCTCYWVAASANANCVYSIHQQIIPELIQFLARHSNRSGQVSGYPPILTIKSLKGCLQECRLHLPQHTQGI